MRKLLSPCPPTVLDMTATQQQMTSNLYLLWRLGRQFLCTYMTIRWILFGDIYHFVTITTLFVFVTVGRGGREYSDRFSFFLLLIVSGKRVGRECTIPMMFFSDDCVILLNGEMGTY